MTRYLVMSFLVLIVCATGLIGQPFPQAKEQQFVLEPRDSALLLVASQPDCPLAIQNPKRYMNVDLVSDVRYEYSLHNRGDKAISDFTIVAWTSFGTGGTLIPRWKFSNDFLSANQTIESHGISGGNKIVALTDELRDRLKLRGPMKAIIVLMVEKIQFSDGSVYKDETTSNSLRHYFEMLDSRRD